MVSAASGAFTAQRAAETAGLRLLRADLMPVLVAILGNRFEDQRIIPYAEFVLMVADDLDELRATGVNAPRAAQEYVTDWVRDGYLVRRPTAAREETVEVSRSAAEAVRFVLGVEQPQSTVTSSRLSNVAGLLGELARDSDPNPERHLEALKAQREQLDDEISRAEAGEYVPLSDAAARERLAEIFRLASEVPGDFAQVADDLETLNRELREQIVSHDGARSGVLGEIFDGVDVIEGSEAGRTFGAFHELLLDPVLSDRFNTAVDAVLERGFTSEVPAPDAAFLRRFLVLLQRESAHVRQRLTDFSRSLRRFVETQEYREHKRLAEALSLADHAALAALKKVHPTTEIGRDLDLSSIAISSIGAWRLHNPADLRPEIDVIEHDTLELDLNVLRRMVRMTEIDFAELEANIADTVADQPGATVGDVLGRFPASQGLASVVGLLLLATQHGVRASGQETWRWASVSGASRTVSAPRYVFLTVPAEWSAHVATTRT
ncbi:DUF3375 domain-containing protein [Tessaracoccus lubricantis]|uniref:DUF3375 domain-containing protein n=1 Tax=Tessaracoccus lubricantis TaxID=545543 RepID=A0ABP9EXM9_9ACTN